MCHDLASLLEHPYTHSCCLQSIREPQTHSHLGSLLGVAQGSAIRAEDSAWLSFLTLEWQGRTDWSGLSHWSFRYPQNRSSKEVLAYYGEFMTRAL